MTDPSRALVEVGPRRKDPGTAEPYADETRLLLDSAGIVVTGRKGQRASFTLATTHRHDKTSVASLVLTRTDTLDQYGGVFDTAIQLLNTDRRVVATVPGRLFDQDELAAFARAAGLPFSTLTLGSYRELGKAFPRVPEVVDIRETTRAFRGWSRMIALGLPVLIMVAILVIMAR